LKKIALGILGKQITNLKEGNMFMDPNGMDEIVRLYWELVRPEIMQMARN
jgi:hypothetical protein